MVCKSKIETHVFAEGNHPPGALQRLIGDLSGHRSSHYRNFIPLNHWFAWSADPISIWGWIVLAHNWPLLVTEPSVILHRAFKGLFNLDCVLMKNTLFTMIAKSLTRKSRVIDKTWLALSCRDSSSVRGGSSEVAAAALGSIGGAIFSWTLKPKYF